MSDGRSLHHLSALQQKGAPSTSVPRPRSRWILRYILPIGVVLLAIALLAYAARDALVPAIEVDVVPVVTRSAAQYQESNISDAPGLQSSVPSREPTIIAQAPGWIEPDPYSITVQPLTSGVVGEVLVLEGDSVRKGDALVRLIAEDAELRARRARAELGELEASVIRTSAALITTSALLDELRDEVDRKQQLLEVGGISPGEFARLKHRLRGQQAEVDGARASQQQAEAAVERQRIVLEEAELELERTIIRAPVNGVVLSRSVVPGTRISLAGDGPGEAHFPGVMRLYDPSQLQVRADVPLADASKVPIGTRARITTEALPDQAFEGEVTRIIHLADIQRNTVQVKVRIHDASPLLKPEMLCRVRFFNRGEVAPAEHTTRTGDSGSLRVYAFHDAIVIQDDSRATVWVAEPGPGGRGRIARLREITIGERDGDFLFVQSGLLPGDRLILNPPITLQPDMRVRVRRIAGELVRDIEGL